ncbi:MAG: hypothetical protein OEZ55_09070 [Nitrospinota bacterium]|nr:hypothetical protein [Nitrospinota bacterium]MDH5756804.1 hypothetical protein [Nitrospinota bacterium]
MRTTNSKTETPKTARAMLFSLARAGALVSTLALLNVGCEKDGSTSFLSTSSEGGGSSFFIPKPEDLVEDPETGLKVIRGTLNIHFSPKIPREEAEKAIAASGGEIVGYDHAVNFFQVRFKLEGAELDKKRIELLSSKNVEMVTATSVSVHEDPYYVK